MTTINIHIAQATFQIGQSDTPPSIALLLGGLLSGATSQEGSEETSKPVDPQTTACAAQPATGPTEEMILEFLDSDDVYSRRTLNAIQKALPGCLSGDVANKVLRMVEDGRLTRVRRRDGGEPLYSVA